MTETTIHRHTGRYQKYSKALFGDMSFFDSLTRGQADHYVIGPRIAVYDPDLDEMVLLASLTMNDFHMLYLCSCQDFTEHCNCTHTRKARKECPTGLLTLVPSETSDERETA